MDTSFLVPRCCPAPPTFLGTISQAHLLLMSLNVAKCNLGKVKFKTMLVSGRPTLRLRGDLFGALCWGCLVACIAFACLLAGLCERSFCSLIFKPFFPLHPPLVSIWSGKYSTDWVQCDGAFGGGRSQGCHGYLLSRASLLPGSTNLFRHHLPSSSIVDEFNGPIFSKYWTGRVLSRMIPRCVPIST